MKLYEMFEVLESHADEEIAKPMAAYMRNLFPFLGIPTPKRREISTPYFKVAKKAASIDWQFIQHCWEKPYREAQYVAIDYIKMMKGFLVLDDIENLKPILVSKSWWDSVDGLHRMVGDIVFKYPEGVHTMRQWSEDENFWLRRVAINHQMYRKEEVNEALLEEFIVKNFGQKEFFINKAIGWMLRDYSKTNPEWVRAFIHRHRDKMSMLSIREGSKYI